MSYNPFDDDADLVYYKQFGPSLKPAARRDARHAAIIWCLKQGFMTDAIKEKVGVSSATISAIRKANNLNVGVRYTPERTKASSEHRTKNAGYTPMTLERAILLRAEEPMQLKELAKKYNISVGFCSQVKRNMVYTS